MAEIEERKKKERVEKVKIEKVELEDENLRKFKAVTEMVKKLIETTEKNEKFDFTQVRLTVYTR